MTRRRRHRSPAELEQQQAQRPEVETWGQDEAAWRKTWAQEAKAKR